MANYFSVSRTNYFRVKDNAAFLQMMDSLSGEDVVLWNETAADGTVYFAFGAYGNIDGLPTSDEENYDFDLFIDTLKKHVAEDDAVILIESGYEKLRYVTGYATIITSDSVEYVSLCDLALKKAGEMLGSKKYETRMDY